MLSIDWLVEEGNKFIIKGRERDWKKFCKDNNNHPYVVVKVLFALQELNREDCDYKSLYDELKKVQRSRIVELYIEAMIVKYSYRGYDFAQETYNLIPERKRLIDKIELSNKKYKNETR